MKNLRFVVLAMVSALLLNSCADNYTPDKEGFTKIENLLQDEFGADAYYTNIAIVEGGSGVGYIINTTVTNDPASLKMGEWNRMKGVWEQTSEVTLELEGGDAEDFMVQLKEINLAKFGELVAASITKIKEEKDIDAVLKIASITMPNDGDVSKMYYFIECVPENGGTTFSLYYKMDGTLDKFDY